MSKVNATWVPAATGLGAGLVLGFESTSVLAAPISVTNASCEPPFNCNWYGFLVGKFGDRVLPAT